MDLCLGWLSLLGKLYDQRTHFVTLLETSGQNLASRCVVPSQLRHRSLQHQEKAPRLFTMFGSTEEPVQYVIKVLTNFFFIGTRWNSCWQRNWVSSSSCGPKGQYSLAMDPYRMPGPHVVAHVAFCCRRPRRRSCKRGTAWIVAQEGTSSSHKIHAISFLEDK